MYDRCLIILSLFANKPSSLLYYNVVGVIRKCVVKGGGTTGVLDRRASEGVERQRTGYARPRITQGHGPTTQNTRIGDNTGRHNNEYVLMNANK